MEEVDRILLKHKQLFCHTLMDSTSKLFKSLKQEIGMTNSFTGRSKNCQSLIVSLPKERQMDEMTNVQNISLHKDNNINNTGTISKKVSDTLKNKPSHFSDNNRKRRWDANSEYTPNAEKQICENNIIENNNKRVKRSSSSQNSTSQTVSIHILTDDEFSEYQKYKNRMINCKQNENNRENNFVNEQNNSDHNMNVDTDVMNNILINSQEYKKFMTSVAIEVQKLFHIGNGINENVNFRLSNEMREAVLQILRNAVFLIVNGLKPHQENVGPEKNRPDAQQTLAAMSADTNKNEYIVNKQSEVASKEQRIERNSQKISTDYVLAMVDNNRSTVTESTYTEPPSQPCSNYKNMTTDNNVSQIQPYDSLNKHSIPVPKSSIPSLRDPRFRSFMETRMSQHSLNYNMTQYCSGTGRVMNHSTSSEITHDDQHPGYYHTGLPMVCPSTSTSYSVSLQNYQKK